MTEARIRLLRDHLFDVAHLAIDATRTRLCEATAATIGQLPKDIREAVEQRAAILEFEAGMERSAATREALRSHAGRPVGRLKPL